MLNLEKFQAIIEGTTVYAPLNFSFSDPLDLLRQLSNFTQLPFFVQRINSFTKGTIKQQEQLSTIDSWCTTYFINENIDAHFKKNGYVYIVPPQSLLLGFASFMFFKKIVIICGLNPLLPLFNCSNIHDSANTFKDAVKSQRESINAKRLELKSLLNLFKCKTAYYCTNNEVILSTLINVNIKAQEHIKLLQDYCLVKNFSIGALSSCNEEELKQTFFIDKFKRLN
jgi:hypothetical protein